MLVSSQKMFFTDVDSLFTNVPLNETVEFLCHTISILNFTYFCPIQEESHLIMY